MSGRATVSIPQAARLLGIGQSSAYRAVQAGDFPVPVIQIGGRFTVPVQPLLDLLSLPELPDMEAA